MDVYNKYYLSFFFFFFVLHPLENRGVTWELGIIRGREVGL